MSETRRPTWWWYVAAAVLAGAGAGVFLVTVLGEAAAYRERVAAFERFVAPGEAELTLRAGARRTVFYENLGLLDGRRFETPQRPMPRMACRVMGPGGGAVEVRQVERVVVYDLAGEDGRRQGHGMWEFAAGQAGGYRVVVERVAGAGATPEVLLAVGELRPMEVVTAWGGVWGATFAAALGLVAGAVLFLVTFVRRQGPVRRD